MPVSAESGPTDRKGSLPASCDGTARAQMNACFWADLYRSPAMLNGLCQAQSRCLCGLAVADRIRRALPGKPLIDSWASLPAPKTASSRLPSVHRLVLKGSKGSIAAKRDWVLSLAWTRHGPKGRGFVAVGRLPAARPCAGIAGVAVLAVGTDLNLSTGVSWGADPL
jgi:hypothetical protein